MSETFDSTLVAQDAETLGLHGTNNDKAVQLAKMVWDRLKLAFENKLADANSQVSQSTSTIVGLNSRAATAETKLAACETEMKAWAGRFTAAKLTGYKEGAEKSRQRIAELESELRRVRGSK